MSGNIDIRPKDVERLLRNCGFSGCPREFLDVVFEKVSGFGKIGRVPIPPSVLNKFKIPTKLFAEISPQGNLTGIKN